MSAPERVARTVLVGAIVMLLHSAAGCFIGGDECDGVQDSPSQVPQGEFVSDPDTQSSELTHPHVVAAENGAEKQLTLDRNARTVIVRYTVEGEEVVETWTF